MAISLDRAESIIRAARRIAGERGEVVSLAVVAADGDLVAAARMDGAPLAAVELAKRKAAVAITAGFDTVHMNTGVPLWQPLFGDEGAESLVPNGGGVVIRAEGVAIGALGVAGAASSIADHKIGTAAISSAG